MIFVTDVLLRVRSPGAQGRAEWVVRCRGCDGWARRRLWRRRGARDAGRGGASNLVDGRRAGAGGWTGRVRSVAAARLRRRGADLTGGTRGGHRRRRPTRPSSRRPSLRDPHGDGSGAKGCSGEPGGWTVPASGQPPRGPLALPSATPGDDAVQSPIRLSGRPRRRAAWKHPLRRAVALARGLRVNVFRARTPAGGREGCFRDEPQASPADQQRRRLDGRQTGAGRDGTELAWSSILVRTRAVPLRTRRARRIRSTPHAAAATNRPAASPGHSASVWHRTSTSRAEVNLPTVARPARRINGKRAGGASGKGHVGRTARREATREVASSQSPAAGSM